MGTHGIAQRPGFAAQLIGLMSRLDPLTTPL
jgi:hypothetical protein